jgi:hypothetical protein
MLEDWSIIDTTFGRIVFLCFLVFSRTGSQAPEEQKAPDNPAGEECGLT